MYDKLLLKTSFKLRWLSRSFKSSDSALKAQHFNEANWRLKCLREKKLISFLPDRRRELQSLVIAKGFHKRPGHESKPDSKVARMEDHCGKVEAKHRGQSTCGTLWTYDSEGLSVMYDHQADANGSTIETVFLFLFSWQAPRSVVGAGGPTEEVKSSSWQRAPKKNWKRSTKAEKERSGRTGWPDWRLFAKWAIFLHWAHF
jgi:hypothetical protein